MQWRWCRDACCSSRPSPNNSCKEDFEMERKRALKVTYGSGTNSSLRRVLLKDNLSTGTVRDSLVSGCSKVGTTPFTATIDRVLTILNASWWVVWKYRASASNRGCHQGRSRGSRVTWSKLGHVMQKSLYFHDNQAFYHCNRHRYHGNHGLIGNHGLTQDGGIQYGVPPPAQVEKCKFFS